MTKPTDRGAENQDSPRADPAKIRKVPMLNPGFRESEPGATTQPRGTGLKRLPNPQDRKNVRFILLAIIVFLVIFCILEFKQLRETISESDQAPAATEQSK